jgi:hypothetical protein
VYLFHGSARLVLSARGIEKAGNYRGSKAPVNFESKGESASAVGYYHIGRKILHALAACFNVALLISPPPQSPAENGDIVPGLSETGAHVKIERSYTVYDEALATE